MNVLSLVLLVLCAFPLGYLLLLAVASARRPSPHEAPGRQPATHFAVAIPAHDERNVIGRTIRGMRDLDYPEVLFAVHVAADHCSDDTAELARQAGAIVHERNEGPRTGKGAALSWLFGRVLSDGLWDAVVVFDADTRVDARFLRVMDGRLAEGEQVVQGQHIISNPDDGWFPALTWAMFIVDNRYRNLGRANLGWSAMNMGDSICFRAETLRQTGWGSGLTEDYQLRHQLLLEGIRIAYEPRAKGYGEAPATWSQAQLQRARWLRGTSDASAQFARRLLVEGIRRRDGALLDGALQARLPSYSTLTLVSGLWLAVQLLANWLVGPVFRWYVVGAWAAGIGILWVYPLFGLALERAPLRAYLAMLSGPIFVLWRTYIALVARLGTHRVPWIRTAHGERK